MNARAGPVRNVSRQPDEQAITRHNHGVVGQDLTSMQLRGIEAHEVDGESSRRCPLDGSVVNLEFADTNGANAWEDPQRGASYERSTTQRARHDGAATLDRKAAID